MKKVYTTLTAVLDNGHEWPLNIEVDEHADAHQRQMAVLRAQAQLAAVAGSDDRVVTEWRIDPWTAGEDTPTEELGAHLDGAMAQAQEEPDDEETDEED